MSKTSAFKLYGNDDIYCTSAAKNSVPPVYTHTHEVTHAHKRTHIYNKDILNIILDLETSTNTSYQHLHKLIPVSW